jgi:hypothetical protein
MMTIVTTTVLRDLFRDAATKIMVDRGRIKWCIEENQGIDLQIIGSYCTMSLNAQRSHEEAD